MISENKQDAVKELLKNATNLEMVGKLKEAAGTIEKAIRLDPNDGNLLNRLGDLYIKMNRPKDALVVYQKGIEAFRNDNFLRNALALCKKILRYDPGNVGVNLTIAQLLIELDERSDAAIYLFSYIERQMAAGNKKEVTKAMEILKNLKVSDRTMADKIATISDKVGEKKKAEEIEQKTKEVPAETSSKIKEELSEIHTVILEDKPERLEPAPKAVSTTHVSDTADRLEKLADELERITGDLRKAMRIDEVVIAIDRSLGVLSQQQKEIISSIDKSLSVNLEDLKRIIAELQVGSRKSIEGIEKAIIQLNHSIVRINDNQQSIIREITGSLEQIGKQFEGSTQKMLNDLRNLTARYESTSQNVCVKVEENRLTTASLLKVGNETKLGIQNISDGLLKYFLSQEYHTKRLNKFMLIMTIILAVMAVLLFISLLK